MSIKTLLIFTCFPPTIHAVIASPLMNRFLFAIFSSFIEKLFLFFPLMIFLLSFATKQQSDTESLSN